MPKVVRKKSKRGRPRKRMQTEPISFRVPVELKRRLEKKAADDQRTLTSYCLKVLTRSVGR